MFGKVVQNSLFSESCSIGGKEQRFNLHIPNRQLAKNYGIPIKYYIPEWDDRVDPNYDFFNDKTTKGRDPYLHDVYSHELYDNPNYDGVLISKVKVEESQTKKERIISMGVHDFIRFPGRPIMGDCGAFSYFKNYEPPYQTQEIIDYYEQLGFNYGVSIDHLIVGDIATDPDERKRRYIITQNNAHAFLKLWKKGNYSFCPIGVAQGWDPDSYRESVACLVDMGYEYVAIGGLARAQTNVIIDILQKVREVIPEYLKVHLFGVARLDPLQEFRRLGMTSFDSATYLRNAWLSSSGKNYYTLDGSYYSAIRVPQSDGQRVKKIIEQGKGTQKMFSELESASLDALRKYDKGHLNIDEVLEKVLAYDMLIGDGRERHAKMYRQTLEDMPWKKCECKICKDIGIEVIIFRGNNRNRRRGFHNTYVFYKRFNNQLY